MFTAAWLSRFSCDVTPRHWVSGSLSLEWPQYLHLQQYIYINKKIASYETYRPRSFKLKYDPSNRQEPLTQWDSVVSRNIRFLAFFFFLSFFFDCMIYTWNVIDFYYILSPVIILSLYVAFCLVCFMTCYEPKVRVVVPRNDVRIFFVTDQKPQSFIIN